jgi:hypothetical protein
MMRLPVVLTVLAAACALGASVWCVIIAYFYARLWRHPLRPRHHRFSYRHRFHLRQLSYRRLFHPRLCVITSGVLFYSILSTALSVIICVVFRGILDGAIISGVFFRSIIDPAVISVIGAVLFRSILDSVLVGRPKPTFPCDDSIGYLTKGTAWTNSF